MSCNGCRVLRKGCSETCILRPCLQWIDTGEAQGHATVFVAKFFGRAGLMSFISAVPEDQRPALFQSLLFEACGRTLNPVSGAVGLLWTGNGSACQAAVDTVLRGGALRPNPELLAGVPLDEASEVICSDPQKEIRDPRLVSKRRISHEAAASPADLGLSLSGSSPTAALPRILAPGSQFPDNWRLGSPSMNSEESGATSCFDRGMRDCNQSRGVPTLLNLFV